jgi:DNA-binding SARP family transcriptional activator
MWPARILGGVVGETLAPEAASVRGLRVYLGGGIALVGANGVVVGERAFPGRQVRRVFVRLVAIHEPVPLADLADDLWATDWPPAWGVALRALLSKVRTTLGRVGAADALIGRGGAYELRLPAGAWLDTDVASGAIHRAETSLSAGDRATACGWALAARAIASRSILPSEEGEWLDDLRRRLLDVRLRAVACLGEIWLANGDARLAARDAAEAIVLDPYRETSHRLLIRAHLAAGEQAAAIRAYDACRATFRDELGVEPATETTALVAPTLSGPDPW